MEEKQMARIPRLLVKGEDTVYHIISFSKNVLATDLHRHTQTKSN